MHIEREPTGAAASYKLGPRPADETATLADTFRRDDVVLVPGLLRGRMLDDVVRGVEGAPFDDRGDRGIARESRMVAPVLLARLIFLANDPDVIDFVRAVTGCPELGRFSGRVYRFLAGAEHFDSWHDDVAGDRRVAMSLNVGSGRPEGGDLLLRAKGSEHATVTRYGDPGDALLFRVAEHLEHQVNPVRGAMPRTAFVGWYLDGGAFADVLQRPA